MSQLQQLRKGSTVLLILTVLEEEPKYGYQIMREMGDRSEGYFRMSAALLYPALHRLEKSGLVSSEWRCPDEERRRKYYTITEAGRCALAEHTREWQTFIDKMSAVIKPPPPVAGEA